MQHDNYVLPTKEASDEIIKGKLKLHRFETGAQQRSKAILLYVSLSVSSTIAHSHTQSVPVRILVCT